MANDVVVRVTARNAVKEGFDLSKRDLKKFSEDAGEIFTYHFGQKIRKLGQQIQAPLTLAGRDMGKSLSEGVSQHLTENIRTTIKEKITTDMKVVGRDLGKTLGKSTSDSFDDELTRQTQTITQRIKQKIRTIVSSDSDTKTRGSSSSSSSSKTHSGGLGNDIDDKGGLLTRFRNFGKEAGQKMSEGIGSSLSTFFSGDLISLLVKVLAGSALAMALAPVIGAAFTTAVGLALGGGVLAVGIAAAVKDPRIQGAFSDLGKKAKSIFTEFGKPFRSPLADFLEKLVGFADRLAPKLQHIANLFAPVLDQLGTGFIGLLQNAMPGILKMVEASKPLFETLARHLPEIGKALGNFFGTIADQGDDANLFFSDLLHLVELTIIGLGKLIAAFTRAYSVVRDFAKAVVGTFKAIGHAISATFNDAKTFVLRFVIFAIEWFHTLLSAAAKAFSWIPGIGGKLRSAEAGFRTFRDHVNAQLRGIHDRSVRIHINVTGIAVLRTGIALAHALQAMQGGRRHGGIQGAAGGGPRSNLTWVGEQGPELVQLPPGSSVRTTGDSMRMMQGGGGQGGGREQVVRLVADHATERTVVGALFKMLRTEIAAQGGNVQVVLGRDTR